MINTFQDIDIYLIDQILKQRFKNTQKILDAGCGSGRNLKWFYAQNFKIYGIDTALPSIEKCKSNFSKQQSHFTVVNIETMPFKQASFDVVICNAVLHFASSEIHFFELFSKLFDVIKKEGILFIRMASIIGLEKYVEVISEGNFKLPDGTTRFLLTKRILKELQKNFTFEFMEPLKTVNVNDKRCMSTLVLKKI